MADFLPTWWKGPEFINVEDLFYEFFQPLMPQVKVIHWMKPSEYGYVPFNGAGADPTLRLWRQPGQWDLETNTDIPLLQVAAVTRSHDDSWELLEFVRSLMKTLANGNRIERSDGSFVSVKNVSQWLGPTIIPEGPVDQFFVPMTYTFEVPGKKLQPDYRSIVKNL